MAEDPANGTTKEILSRNYQNYTQSTSFQTPSTPPPFKKDKQTSPRSRIKQLSKPLTGSSGLLSDLLSQAVSPSNEHDDTDIATSPVRVSETVHPILSSSEDGDGQEDINRQYTDLTESLNPPRGRNKQSRTPSFSRSNARQAHTPELIPLNNDTRGPLRKGTPLRPTITSSVTTSSSSTNFHNQSGAYGRLSSRSMISNKSVEEALEDDEFEDEGDRLAMEAGNDTLSSNIPDDLTSPEFRRQPIARIDQKEQLILDTEATKLGYQGKDERRPPPPPPQPRFESRKKKERNRKGSISGNFERRSSPLRNVYNLERSSSQENRNQEHPEGEEQQKKTGEGKGVESAQFKDPANILSSDHKPTPLYPSMNEYNEMGEKIELFAPEILTDEEVEELERRSRLDQSQSEFEKDEMQENRNNEEEINHKNGNSNNNDEDDDAVILDIHREDDYQDQAEQEQEREDEQYEDKSGPTGNTGFQIKSSISSIPFDDDSLSDESLDGHEGPLPLPHFSKHYQDDVDPSTTATAQHRRKSLVEGFVDTLNRLNSRELTMPKSKRSTGLFSEGHSIRDQLEQKFGSPSDDEDLQPPVLNEASLLDDMNQRTPPSTKVLLENIRRSIERGKNRLSGRLEFNSSLIETPQENIFQSRRSGKSSENTIEQHKEDSIPLETSTVLKEHDSTNRILASPISQHHHRHDHDQHQQQEPTTRQKRPISASSSSQLRPATKKRKTIIKLGPYESYTSHQWQLFRRLYRKYTTQGRDLNVFNDLKTLEILRIYDMDMLLLKIEFWEDCLRSGKVKF